MKDCPVSLFLQCRKVSNVRRSQGTLRGTPMLAGDAYRVPRRDRQQAHKPLVHAWVGERLEQGRHGCGYRSLHPAPHLTGDGCPKSAVCGNSLTHGL